MSIYPARVVKKKNNISINEYWTLIHSFEKQQQQLPYSKQKYRMLWVPPHEIAYVRPLFYFIIIIFITWRAGRDATTRNESGRAVPPPARYDVFLHPPGRHATTLHTDIHAPARYINTYDIHKHYYYRLGKLQ